MLFGRIPKGLDICKHNVHYLTDVYVLSWPVALFCSGHRGKENY